MSVRREGPGLREGFDALALVERRVAFSGTTDLRSLPRLSDRLADGGPAKLGWRIAGTTDAAGRPALALSLEGRVPLTCQRCLEPFALQLAQQTLLLLARDEQELARLDDDDEHEVVLAAAPLQVQDLIEEEVLLTLPYVPRCGEPQCDGAANSVVVASATTGSAFAALKALKPASGGRAGKKHRT